MTHSKAEYKRYSIVGPGGHKCACCYPAPGKARNFMEKKWKRKERQQFKRILPSLMSDQ